MTTVTVGTGDVALGRLLGRMTLYLVADSVNTLVLKWEDSTGSTVDLTGISAYIQLNTLPQVTIWAAVLDIPNSTTTWTLTPTDTASATLRRRSYTGRMWLERGTDTETAYSVRAVVQR